MFYKYSIIYKFDLDTRQQSHTDKTVDYKTPIVADLARYKT